MKFKKVLIVAVLFTVVGVLFSYIGPVFSQRVAFYGDSRYGHDIHGKIVKLILKKRPKIVFHTGDFVTDSAAEWPTVKSIIFDLEKNNLRRNNNGYLYF